MGDWGGSNQLLEAIMAKVTVVSVTLAIMASNQLLAKVTDTTSYDQHLTFQIEANAGLTLQNERIDA